MNNLDITDAKEKKMDVVEDLAIEVVRRALVGELPADEEQVKLACKTCSVTAKNRQTLTNRKAIESSMAFSIATEAEKKKYIKATHPHVLKALTGK